MSGVAIRDDDGSLGDAWLIIVIAYSMVIRLRLTRKRLLSIPSLRSLSHAGEFRGIGTVGNLRSGSS